MGSAPSSDGKAGRSRGGLGRRAYGWLGVALTAAVVVYLLLLCFPQVLFSHEVTHHNFTVYAREPLDPAIDRVLDSVEARLSAAGFGDSRVRPRIFLTGSHRFYSLLSLYVGGDSFAKGFAALATTNVFVNRADPARDLVFRDAPSDNQRDLSQVLAHEVTHLLLQERLGYVRNLTAPSWKKEGFCEYVSGGTQLDRETGARRWRESPRDDSRYRYFKYYILVKYLLDEKKLSAEDLFKRDFDVRALEAEVLAGL